MLVECGDGKLSDRGGERDDRYVTLNLDLMAKLKASASIFSLNYH